LSFDLREKCGGVLGFVDNKGLSVFAQKKARITFSEQPSLKVIKTKEAGLRDHFFSE